MVKSPHDDFACCPFLTVVLQLCRHARIPVLQTGSHGIADVPRGSGRSPGLSGLSSIRKSSAATAATPDADASTGAYPYRVTATPATPAAAACAPDITKKFSADTPARSPSATCPINKV